MCINICIKIYGIYKIKYNDLVFQYVADYLYADTKQNIFYDNRAAFVRRR